MPDIVLYFLQASRSIRTAWLLEELHLPYTIKFAPRENNKAPASFKADCGHSLGRFPTMRDGDLIVAESGAITDYLLETYDTEGKLLPKDRNQRAQVRQWIHAAEATFMIHSLAITYARWNMPKKAKEEGVMEEMEKGLSVKVHEDFDWLESELRKGNGKFLVGEGLTAADTMVAFSVQFILARGLGTKGEKWPKVEAWLKGLEQRETYKKAVEKSGYQL